MLTMYVRAADWHASAVAPFGNTVTLLCETADGDSSATQQQQRFSTLERPKLLLDSRGNPTHLSNGACTEPSCNGPCANCKYNCLDFTNVSPLDMAAPPANPPLKSTDESSRPPPPPAAPCPPACEYYSKSKKKGCGVVTKLPNGTQGYVCPKALAFSVGFDSDMVLQRAPAKAAVYGQMVGGGDGASVSVTVSEVGGSRYTVKALIAPAPAYCLPSDPAHLGNGCAANYSASWKVLLKPAPAGGEYTITAVCTGCDTGDGARSTSSIHRVTYGDVYFCSGEEALPCTTSCMARASG